MQEKEKEKKKKEKKEKGNKKVITKQSPNPFPGDMYNAVATR